MLHQIGVGALGPVFRTYEPERDRLVAVKAFRLDITPEQARALADELSAVCDRGLFHPSIVEPVAAGIEGTVAYRAEEYVAAESLDIVMRQQAPVSIDTVLLIMTQLAGAIDFARAAGIGHGGLHPRDIFFTPDGEACATGFGVVEALERVGLRAPVRRPYSAPERIAAGPWGTPADVFSMAAIVYELLTGRRPSGFGAQIGPLTAGTPNQWTDALHAVLARAMEEDPQARQPTALAFAADLKAAAQGGPDPGWAPVSVPGVTGAPAAAATAASAAGDAFADARPLPVQTHEAGDLEDAPPDDAPGDEQPIVRIDPARAAMDSRLPPDRPADVDRFREVDQAPEPGSFEEARLVPVDLPAPVSDPELDAPGPVRAPLDVDREDSRAASPPAGQDRLRPAREPESVSVTRGRMPEWHAAAAAPAEPRKRSIWPVAAVLLLGLLAGFGGGYALWGRGAAETPGGPEGGAGLSGTAVDTGAALPPEPRGTNADPVSGAAGGDGTGAPAEAPAPATGSGPAAPSDPPPPAAGRLLVRSTPSGAGVTVNGRWRGRTPLTLDDLPFSKYQVRIVEPGYRAATQAVALSEATPEGTVSVRLQREPPTRQAARPSAPAASPARSFSGSIYVDSRPRGARVSINGKPVGVTPLRVPEMRIGTHVVRMELPDHRIWTSTARVTAGQEVRVTGSLEPIR